MSASQSRRTKILFLAWGYSIHAKRRIQIFTEDPSFEVTVVSTYAYGFTGAVNILLPPDHSFVARVLAWLEHRNIDLMLLRVINDVWNSLFHMARLIKVTKKSRPDVIFLQTLLYPCYLYLLLPGAIPMMVTFWNGDVTWWAKWNGIERMFKKQIVTRGVRRARAITVNSQAAFDACIGYGAAFDKIHLIRYPGVDMGRFYPANKAKARQKIGIAGDHIVFAPRGLGGYLNSDVFIEAAARVVKQIPEVVFIISCAVGQGEELEKHTDHAMALGIADNCRWISKIAWEEMPDAYNASDVMVSISSNDSLPNCMMEAMACGVPVIMGDIPQIREWIVDGENGFLVPVRDASLLAERIVDVLRNTNHITDLIVGNALAVVTENLDSRKTVPLVKQLVTSVVKEAGHV